VSRNNDVDGYWAIGKLYLLAKTCNSRKIRIDLLAKQISPPRPELQRMLDHYHSRFQALLLAVKIPSGWIHHCEIELEFGSFGDVVPGPRNTYGGRESPMILGEPIWPLTPAGARHTGIPGSGEALGADDFATGGLEPPPWPLRFGSIILRTPQSRRAERAPGIDAVQEGMYAKVSEATGKNRPEATLPDSET